MLTRIMTQAHTLNSRNQTIDVLKLVAAFFVICIHTKTTSSIDKFEQHSFSFIVDNVARFAVPFFFMTSGYFINFANRNKLFKRLLAVAVIYALWSAIFIFIRWYNKLEYPIFNFTESPINETINTLYKTLFYGWERHLWFFPAYIIAALMITAFHQHKKTLLLLIIIFYAIGLTGQQFRFIYPAKLSFIPMQSFDYEWLQKPYITRNGFFFAFPCMAAGYLIQQAYKSIIKIPTYLSLSLIALLFILQYAECIYLMQYNSNTTADYYIATLLLSIFILIAAIQLPANNKLLSSAGRMSGGVYLIHPLFMYFFLVNFKELFSHPLWPYLFTPGLFVLSFITAWLISKIPLIKKAIMY